MLMKAMSRCLTSQRNNA